MIGSRVALISCTFYFYCNLTKHSCASVDLLDDIRASKSPPRARTRQQPHYTADYDDDDTDPVFLETMLYVRPKFRASVCALCARDLLGCQLRRKYNPTFGLAISGCKKAIVIFPRAHMFSCSHLLC